MAKVSERNERCQTNYELYQVQSKWNLTRQFQAKFIVFGAIGVCVVYQPSEFLQFVVLAHVFCAAFVYSIFIATTCER